MRVIDLGICPYQQAWKIQEEHHAQVLAGLEEVLLLVEHRPVITFGRRPDPTRFLISSETRLNQLGIELVQSDRGGDITFHGPGQLVAYPIIRLIDHHLSVGAYMHRLEKVVIDVLREFAIESFTDPQAVGVWVRQENLPGKICALGVRIRRGVSMHGLALNVSTDLSYFTHINPCGLSRPVTSIMQLLGDRAPKMEQVKESLIREFRRQFAVEKPMVVPWAFAE